MAYHIETGTVTEYRVVDEAGRVFDRYRDYEVAQRRITLIHNWEALARAKVNFSGGACNHPEPHLELQGSFVGCPLCGAYFETGS